MLQVARQQQGWITNLRRVLHCPCTARYHLESSIPAECYQGVSRMGGRLCGYMGRIDYFFISFEFRLLLHSSLPPFWCFLLGFFLLRGNAASLVETVRLPMHCCCKSSRVQAVKIHLECHHAVRDPEQLLPHCSSDLLVALRKSCPSTSYLLCFNSD